MTVKNKTREKAPASTVSRSDWFWFWFVAACWASLYVLSCFG